MKNFSLATTAIVAMIMFSTSANAGRLFPPSNIGADPNTTCPSGQVLSWQRDHVDCMDPTPGVSLSCPAGQLLTGITNGTPVCVPPSGGGSTIGSGIIPVAANFQGSINSGITLQQGHLYRLNLAFLQAAGNFGGISLFSGGYIGMSDSDGDTGASLLPHVATVLMAVDKGSNLISWQNWRGFSGTIVAPASLALTFNINNQYYNYGGGVPTNLMWSLEMVF